MAKEILTIPEQYLMDVIAVIEAGLQCTLGTPQSVIDSLKRWCEEEKEYIERMSEGETDDR